jgi:hypothetical protein
MMRKNQQQQIQEIMILQPKLKKILGKKRRKNEGLHAACAQLYVHMQISVTEGFQSEHALVSPRVLRLGVVAFCDLIILAFHLLQ